VRDSRWNFDKEENVFGMFLWFALFCLAAVVVAVVITGCTSETYKLGIDKNMCECKNEPLAIVDIKDGGYDCVCGDS
jgi:hypothetical protein